MQFDTFFPGAKRKTIYSPELAEMLGDVHAALLLSQLVHWEGKQWDKKHRWIRKTQEEWESELAMTRSQLEKARRILVEAGLIEVTRKGVVPPKTGYRLKEREIKIAWKRFQEGHSPRSVAEKKAALSLTNRKNLKSARPVQADYSVSFEQEEVLERTMSIPRIAAEQAGESERHKLKKESRTNCSTSPDYSARYRGVPITGEDVRDDSQNNALFGGGGATKLRDLPNGQIRHAQSDSRDTPDFDETRDGDGPPPWRISEDDYDVFADE